MEKKVYESYAFTENEDLKMKINLEILKELKEKYRIKSTYQGEDINYDDYDLIYERKAGYNHGEYYIKKNNTNLTSDELALIFDDGNLCFGYTKKSETFYYVFED